MLDYITASMPIVLNPYAYAYPNAYPYAVSASFFILYNRWLRNIHRTGKLRTEPSLRVC